MQAIWIRAVVIVAMLTSVWTGAGWAQALRVVGFNVESGGALPDVVDDLIAAAREVDLWGFSEVQDAIWATMFAQAAAEGETGTFAPILGTTGGGDRLLIVYRVDRFDLVRSFELTDIAVTSAPRWWRSSASSPPAPSSSSWSITSTEATPTGGMSKPASSMPGPAVRPSRSSRWGTITSTGMSRTATPCMTAATICSSPMGS
jgi:hypothetical protein